MEPTKELTDGGYLRESASRRPSVCLAIPALTASLRSVTDTLNYNWDCAYADFPSRLKTPDVCKLRTIAQEAIGFMNECSHASTRLIYLHAWTGANLLFFFFTSILKLVRSFSFPSVYFQNTHTHTHTDFSLQQMAHRPIKYKYAKNALRQRELWVPLNWGMPHWQRLSASQQRLCCMELVDISFSRMIPLHGVGWYRLLKNDCSAELAGNSCEPSNAKSELSGTHTPIT